MFKIFSKLFGTSKAESKKVETPALPCTPEVALSIILMRLVESGDLRNKSGEVYSTVSSFINNHPVPSDEYFSFSTDSLYELLYDHDDEPVILAFINKAKLLKMRISTIKFRLFIYD